MHVKIGIPNFLLLLVYLFCTGFFVFGLLAAAGAVEPARINGVAVFFVLFCWVFSGYAAIFLIKGFRWVRVDAHAISVRAILPSKEKKIRFKEIKAITWGASYNQLFKSTYRRVHISDESGTVIFLSDSFLENLDSIMDAVPFKNESAKNRVSQKQAKEEYLTISFLLLLSAASFLFFAYDFNYIGQFIKLVESRNWAAADLFIGLGLPVVHGIIVWAFLRRFLRYTHFRKKLALKTKTGGKTTKTVQTSPFLASFEYQDHPTMGYFAGSSEVEGQEHPVEVYFCAPNEIVHPEQESEFRKLLENTTAIKKKLNKELNRLLTLEGHAHLDILVPKPISFSIISVLHGGKDLEGVLQDYTIELLASKPYKSFGVKRGEFIVGMISNGKLIEMARD